MVRVDRNMNRRYQQLMSELGFFGRGWACTSANG
jgi:hypothetical protein